eukprot:TRINITY_DN10634_c0_g1_i1.p1 TRINITY_DN10634_c0_g1~~TRINITY_DN10634_c0_g1_i1.p1  ORF type:complete len:107 (-),score=1.81 TRINITY_DN10634_c0_g1_i1:142-462(-)
MGVFQNIRQMKCVTNQSQHDSFIKLWIDHYNRTIIARERLDFLGCEQYEYEVMMSITLKHFECFVKRITEIKLSQMRTDHPFSYGWFGSSDKFVVEAVKWHVKNVE